LALAAPAGSRDPQGRRVALRAGHRLPPAPAGAHPHDAPEPRLRHDERRGVGRRARRQPPGDRARLPPRPAEPGRARRPPRPRPQFPRGRAPLGARPPPAALRIGLRPNALSSTKTLPRTGPPSWTPPPPNPPDPIEPQATYVTSVTSLFREPFELRDGDVFT